MTRITDPTPYRSRTRRSAERGSVWLLVSTTTLLCMAPSRARAVDGMRVRTPVVWSDLPCVLTVDRSIDPVLHIPYSIPFEDTDVTKDEVPDGRTHQFFAWCRDHDPSSILPQWISQADVDAAEAMGLIDRGIVADDAIVDLSREWAGCFERINADDERRPITFAAADEGVDWDTTGIAAGAWVIEGFTHDPPLNRWSDRRGVVRVVDFDAPNAIGPAAALMTQETVIYEGETATIEGCIAAAPGSEFDLRWAAVGQDRWHTAIGSEPVAGQALALELELPPDTIGQGIRVRLDARDPQGRQTTAFMSEYVLVLSAPGCTDGECGSTGADSDGDSGADAADTDGGTDNGSLDATAGPDDSATSSEVTGESTAGTNPGQPGEATDGCSCSTQHETPWWAALGLPWLVAATRQRRRDRTR